MKAAFTIVTINYISYAKTLGESLKRFNPEYSFIICLIGEKKSLNKSVDLTDFILIELSEINDSTIIESMVSRYSAFELSCALKPFFAEFIIKNKFITRLKYLDSDIMIYNAFDKNIEGDTTSSIFLTPHFFTPVIPLDNTTNDSTLLKSGVFNAGYFEINKSETADLFLRWWKDRLFKYCYCFKFPLNYLFVDQSWLNLVPIYFKNTVIVNHLGYNTSFYNLHERRISKIDGRYFININSPLVFFHFTGYKYNQHEKVSIYNQNVNYENTPYLEPICNEYKQALIENAIHLILSSNNINKSGKKSIIKFLGSIVNKLLRRYLNVKITKIND